MEEISDIDASETFYKINDLEPYTQYRFEIVAITDNSENGVIGDIEVVTMVARKLFLYANYFKNYI